MVYPATRQTFPEQFPDTVADNDFINDITDLLVALEDMVGLTGDSPGPGTHESRLKRLEGGGLPRFFFLATTPPGPNILGDIWINTSTDPWIEYYWNGTVWHVIGSDAVFLGSKQVDNTTPPTDNQVPIYNSSTDRIEWGTALINPLSAPGQLIVGGTAGAPTALSPGADYDVLNINPTTNLPQWSPTPKFFNQLYLRQYMDFIESTSPPSVSASGEIRLYADASQHKLYYSANGASYAELGSGGTDLSDLLSSKGSMVYASDNIGTLARLDLGVEGSTLVVVAGLPVWMSNVFIPFPATAVNGAVIYFDGSTWLPIPPGTSGQFLKTFGAGTAPAWTDLPSSPPGSGIVSPAGSTTGDVLVHDATDWIRLPAGVAGRVLQTNGTSGPPSWVALPTTFSNPMTTTGDMIYATVGGSPVRLAGGTGNNDKFLSIVAGSPVWVDNPASLGRQMWMSG